MAQLVSGCFCLCTDDFTDCSDCSICNQFTPSIYDCGITGFKKPCPVYSFLNLVIPRKRLLMQLYHGCRIQSSTVALATEYLYLYYIYLYIYIYNNIHARKHINTHTARALPDTHSPPPHTKTIRSPHLASSRFLSAAYFSFVDCVPWSISLTIAPQKSTLYSKGRRSSHQARLCAYIHTKILKAHRNSKCVHLNLSLQFFDLLNLH